MVSKSLEKNIWSGLAIIGALSVISVIGGIIITGVYVTTTYQRTDNQRQKLYHAYT